MKIDRIEDKKFQIVITEDEALSLSDASAMDFAQCKTTSIAIGTILLHYMMEACEFPHDNKPTLDITF